MKIMKPPPTIREREFKKIPVWHFIVSAPFIYGMFFPLLFVHITAEVYHQVCFRLYGLKLLNWREYIVIDRHKLKKLAWYEKFNCVYCGYANGLSAYLVDVAGETEAYWCAVKHQSKLALKHQPHEQKFHNRKDFS